MSERDSSSSGTDGLEGDLIGDRPRGDAIARAQARARLESELFDEPAEPVKVDRFVIIKRLGQGGMGVVYSAYDPQLDRRVALKLLRPRGGGDARRSIRARDRLLREAKALAQLAHPNVVGIHEVGLIEEQVFIVMEFVVGQTLREWFTAESRSWREVIAVLCQAGRGLSAAHALDLVHRDFKPDNVIVGDDGRVRVLDFGLARGLRAEDAIESSELDSIIEEASGPTRMMPGDMLMTGTVSSDGGRGVLPGIAPGIAINSPGAVRSPELMPDGLPESIPEAMMGLESTAPAEAMPTVSDSGQGLDAELTISGAMIGTPAYMSPEQFANAGIGPLADQFGFCASLFEALHGERPFDGDDFDTLRANILTGTMIDPPRGSRVPKRIHAAVCRGMAPRRDDRYASMDELLAVLQRDPARAWRRRLVGVAFVVLAGVIVLLLARGPAPPTPCTGGVDKVAAIWSPERRQVLRSAILGTEVPYAEPAWPRIAGDIDAYSAGWSAMHREACVANQRGEQSDKLFDQRMVCLERRLEALDNTIAVLETTDPETLTAAVEATGKLPPLDYCSNVEALQAEVPPPDDPDQARRVDGLRDRLSEVRALEDAGHHDEALERVIPLVVDSRREDYAPMIAEALLARGRIELASRTRDKGAPWLREATEIGLRAGMNRLAVESLARLVYAETTTAGERASEILALVPFFEALSQQVPDRTFAYALLLNNAGVAHLTRRDRDVARGYFQRALDFLDRESSVPLELAVVPGNLAIVTSEWSLRMALFERALRQRERALGAEHAQSLQIRLMYGHYVADPVQGREIVREACSMYRRYHPDHVSLGQCEYYLAFLYSESGSLEAAAEHFALAAESNQKQDWNALASGYRALYDGDPVLAMESFTTAIELASSDATAWWNKKLIADARHGMAMSLGTQGQTSRAIVELERAIDTYRSLEVVNEDVEYRQRLAASHVELATLLWDASAKKPPQDPARTRALAMIAAAETWFASAPAGYAWRMEQLENWRRDRAVAPR